MVEAIRGGQPLPDRYGDQQRTTQVAQKFDQSINDYKEAIHRAKVKHSLVDNPDFLTNLAQTIQQLHQAAQTAKQL